MAEDDERLEDLPPVAGVQAGDLLYLVRGGIDYRLVPPTTLAGWGVTEQVVPVDYAGIRFDHNAVAQTIDLVDVYHLLDEFDTDGPDEDSVADAAAAQIVFGAGRTYWVFFQIESDVVGASQSGVFDAFNIDQTAAAITGVTQATPGVVTTGAAHGLLAGDYVKITGVVGMTELNDKVFKVANVAGGGTTFELTDDEDVDIDTAGYGAWVSDGTTQKATATGAHTDRKYDNGALGSASCGFPFVAVEGDAVELYFKNESSANNITHEGSVLTVHALSQT